MTETTIPQQIARLDAARLRAYRENLDFYNGAQWAGRSRQRRLTLNYARVFIDKVSSYVMSGLDFVVEPAGNSAAARARAHRVQEALHEVYEANNLAEIDFDSEVDAAILGDGCFKVTWDVAERRVRISAPDVQGIFAWWLGDDVTQVWRVASRYRLSSEEVEMLYGVKQPASGGLRKESTVVEVWTAGDFELWVDDSLIERKANPYGFIPFIVFPNLREPKKFWGVSDLPPLMEPARELNRALSQLSTILELSGNPIAVLENVEEARDIAVQPGAVWEIPEKAKAYLLDLLQGGGINLHISYTDLIYRTLHDLSETPRTAFGDNRQGLSGVALEMELNPLLQKVRRKRLLRTSVFQRRNEMILRILESAGGGTGVSYRPYRSRIVWGPVLPQDRSRLVTDEEALVRSGIHSRRRAMQELGVEDPEAEWKQVGEEGGVGAQRAVPKRAVPS